MVFKWARDANAKLKERVKAKKKHAVDLNIAQLRTMPSIGVNMIRDEKDLKVLMVDQLWCWIINEGEFSTNAPELCLLVSRQCRDFLPCKRRGELCILDCGGWHAQDVRPG